MSSQITTTQIIAMWILIILTSVIALLSHLGMLEYAVMYLDLSWYVQLAIPCSLLIFKIGAAIINYYPVVKRVLTALVTWSNRPVAAASSGTPVGPSAIKQQKRGFATSAVRYVGNQVEPESPRGLRIKTSNPSLYSRLLNTMKPVNAMLSVKRGRPLVNHLLRMVSLLGLEKSLGLIKVIIKFCDTCYKHIQHSSVKGLVIYLKACSVTLQQASGGHRLRSMNGLKVRFRRTKGAGYPRIIPALHRGRLNEPKIFKLWMTLFALYRVLEMPYKLNLSTITSPSRMDMSCLPVFAAALEGFWSGLSNLSGFDDTRIGQNWLEPLDFAKSLRATPFIISKSSSAAGVIRLNKDDPGVLSTAPASILAAVAAWHEDPAMMSILNDWCSFTRNTWVLNRLDSWNKALLPMCDPADPVRAPLYKGMRTILGTTYARSLGRLGFKEEAAGKLRVFAYVDPFTQWLMKPLHDALFELLALIPQDGTRDQMAPIHRLLERRPNGPFYSYDLTAATDRLPLVVQKTILAKLLTPHGAHLWAAMLVGRMYHYVYKPQKGRVVTGQVVYETGQPMGALSSWAMLAVTHHSVVQIAALNTGKIKPGEWFEDYAVLGDDIVIADADVAEEYLRLMELLGVDIGLAKSLISPKGGTLEFAKRTIHKHEDVSPLPFSEYWIAKQNLPSAMELIAKYKLLLPQYLDLFGFGYRAKGSVTGNLMSLGRRLRHRVLSYFSPLGSDRMGLKEFLAMKGLNRFYTWTEAKASALLSQFVTVELNKILERLNSAQMEKLIQMVKLISTVNKDREFYGTLSRSAPGARKIDLEGLDPRRTTYAWNDESPAPRSVDIDVYYHVIDDLCHTVYREAYLDVLSELRELRYAIEDAIKSKSGPTLADLDVIIHMYFDFQSTLANIPLPKELYYRVEAEARTSNLELIKQWEVYSRYLRSTLST